MREESLQMIGGLNGTLKGYSQPTYIFYSVGATYYLQSGSSGAIDYQGTNAADVLQQGINFMGTGTIYFRPQSASYVITKTITGPAGIFLHSDGAMLDVTSMNTTVFQFGNDAVWNHNVLTGMEGFNVSGTPTNTSLLLISVSQVDSGVIVEQISTNGVSQAVNVRGACYNAILRDVVGFYGSGNYISVTGFNISGTVYAPNNMIVDHCEITADANVGGIAINLDSGANSPDGCVITKCWVERVNVGIKLGGKNHRVLSNIIEAYSLANNMGVWVGPNASAPTIIGNTIEAIGATANGIYIDAPTSTVVICDNTFPYMDGAAIMCSAAVNAGGGVFGTVSGNIVSVNSGGTFINGCFYTSAITGNQFAGAGLAQFINFPAQSNLNNISGNVVNRPTVFMSVSAGCYDNTVVGNMISQCGTSGINITNMHATFISGNFFYNTATPIAGVNSGGNDIRGNFGYMTMNNGVSTGTGAQQTIPHGLATTPLVVMFSEGTTGGALARQSATADATNIYVTATNGKDYVWRAGSEY